MPYSERLVRIIMMAVFINLLACEDSTDKPHTKQAHGAEKETLALTVSGSKVSLSEIDQLIHLKLYDLEWAKYELRQQAVTSYLQNSVPQVSSSDLNILLSPPQPPRLALTDTQRQSALHYQGQGHDEAPIRISVFCNYQSSHCARIQLIYQAITDAYGQLVSFEFFDFPQGYHAFSVAASQAAHCAYSMGQFDGFHKALWLSQHDLGQENFLRIAAQLKMEKQAFLSCLQSESYLTNVQRNKQLAETLGLTQVPVTLINGLYLSGPKPLEVFLYFIDQELARMGVQKDAMISPDTNAPDSFKDELPVPVDNDEHLPTEAFMETESNNLPEDIPDADELEYTPRPVVPAVGELPLSREWLDEQLMQQSELASHFQAAEHEVEGVRLMKLQDVTRNTFYQTLGFQEGDVLMRVNDQWVHEAQNDLFSVLEKDSRVSVVLVRKGLPVQLMYHIK